MFTICIVGCGWMSSAGHGPSLKKYAHDRDNIVLAGCCDLNEKRAEDYKEKFGFKKCYTDYRKMIEECLPDAVSVIMPVDLTAGIAADIMSLGCNVMMEKPPGKNIEETQALIDTAHKYNVSAHVSFNRRYFPIVTEMMRRIKETGEAVNSITCQMYRYNRTDADFSTTMVHAIDAVKYISASEFTRAEMTYIPAENLGKGVKDIFMTCHFKNGAAASIAAVPNCGAVTERFTVNTRSHTYFADLPVWDNIDTPGKLADVSMGGNAETVKGNELCDTDEMFEMSGFYGSNSYYFDLLREGKTLTDLESAVDCIRLQDAVRESKTEWIKE